MQKISFEKGFKYFYEAKTIKLLLEGILLEKAEDEIEHELSLKGGDATGWDVMNIEKYEKARKEKEFKNNLELAKISNDLEAINKEKEFKEQMELEENNIKKKRNECKKIWQEIWGEIWIPSIAYNGEQDLVTKRKFVQNVISEIIFKLFKTKLFDVWKFKNILNNTDQYIILEKIKKYLAPILNLMPTLRLKYFISLDQNISSEEFMNILNNYNSSVFPDMIRRNAVLMSE